jgi:D-threo-aldose 1-dehydrogenase
MIEPGRRTWRDREVLSVSLDPFARPPLSGEPARKPLIFGGAPIGGLYEPVSDENAAATLGAAWQAGVRAFDTAPHYGAGLSEKRLGDGVRASLEDSLRRLRLDRADIALIHDPDDFMAQARDSAYPALAELRADGVVGAIGVGMNSTAPLA